MEETPADTNENDRENLILSFEDAAKIAQARATSNEFQQKKSTSELKGLKVNYSPAFTPTGTSCIIYIHFMIEKMFSFKPSVPNSIMLHFVI